ncbi:4Fe-4S dicluster domain-containing protein [Rudanella paleaurantiibacter]|uniref:4Fe-4S dicluster domain-containing protein n=1 Tax=Rudanella paleaurantiibacter TaxID=2614655 RepID=A0A7J5TXS5_9BACT|nr:4Fe-4S dicluster domain-containing protein [Rudanella paleaurantiibacter]KAB7729371.1 4Fe-4S dicluster domain-containing protein [Rudanella paleaurantiibacter]
MSYFQDIKDGIRTTLKGLSITARHLREATESRKPLAVASDNYFEQQTGLVTVQYPHETLPIPDNGRYRLHNEIDDCIVCDKCAKVCPVDCITIDAIKATEEVGRASDGSPIRLYAATFDIDMAKCCYCGLCTVVCPTECLTMEKTFDYSEFELGKLTYGFANLTPEQAEEKRTLYEQFVQEKAAQKAQQAAKPVAPATPDEAPKVARPVFRPTAKPKTTDVQPSEVDRPAAEASPAIITSGTDPATQQEHTVQPTEAPGADGSAPKPKPAFRPSMKPPVAKTPPAAPIEPVEDAQPTAEKVPAPKPAFRPTMKPPVAKANPEVPEASTDPQPAESKPAFRPTMKPKAAPADPQPTVPAEAEAAPTASKPAFRPTMKPKPVDPQPAGPTEAATQPEADVQKPKPVFRPTMKPKSTPADSTETTKSPDATAVDEGRASIVSQPTPPEPVAPKPAFRPTMKPKPAASAPEASAEPVSQKGPETTPDADTPAVSEPPKPKPAFRPTMKPKNP